MLFWVVELFIVKIDFFLIESILGVELNSVLEVVVSGFEGEKDVINI